MPSQASADLKSKTNAEQNANQQDSMHAPLELPASNKPPRFNLRISVFWRTLFWLSTMLFASSFGWYQIYKYLEYEPRLIENAKQIASLVNLSRAALIHSDAIARVSLMKTLAEEEKVRIMPREPNDKFALLKQTTLGANLSDELIEHLGEETIVASQVNDESGLWIGFTIEGDSYWLLMDRERAGSLISTNAWLLSIAVLTMLSFLMAAWFARLINRPLAKLSQAAEQVKEGNYNQSLLDEASISSEVRDVNIGFNKMAAQLSKIENDRTEMLAGISHDLRTPLARLRLELEMSVPDEIARENMAADISQIDTIINKFLDYARPYTAKLQSITLIKIVQSCAKPFLAREDMQIEIDMDSSLTVVADEIQLSRVLSNLLENARRYGKTPEPETNKNQPPDFAQTSGYKLPEELQEKSAGITQVKITAFERDGWIILRIKDHGRGVPEELLSSITKPFYRADTARTEATGSGLGLAIVGKMLASMGATFTLRNSEKGGLMVTIGLKTVSQPEENEIGTN